MWDFSQEIEKTWIWPLFYHAETTAAGETTKKIQNTNITINETELFNKAIMWLQWLYHELCIEHMEYHELFECNITHYIWSIKVISLHIQML